MTHRIDIVSDLVCPWCFIGTRNLYASLANRAEPVELVFHPFELDPSVPAEGRDLRQALAAKFGAAPKDMFARVEAAARNAGIPLDFEKITRYPSTLAGHALIAAAKAKGTQRALTDALFSAYFLGSEDIGDTNAIARIAAHHGFTVDEATAIATDPPALARVRAEAQSHSRSGIHGVPFFIFDEQFAVSGAQPPQVFDQALAKLGV